MSDENHKTDVSLKDLRTLHNRMPRWVVTLLIVGTSAVIAYHIAHLLMLLIVSAVIAYILSSTISVFEALGIKRSVAVIQLFVLAAVFVVSAYIVLSPHLQREIKRGYVRLPELSRQIEATILPSAEDSTRYYPAVGSAVRKLTEDVVGPGGFVERTLSISAILTQATSVITGLILVPFFVFFMLKDWPKALNKIMRLVAPSYVETTLSIIAEINILVGKYLRGLVGDCVFIGVIASLGLWLIGFNYPILFGVLSGLANVVPYVGPLIACAAASLTALIQFNSVDSALTVVVLYLLIKLTDDLFVQPLMIGKTLELHPMLLVITIIAGENLFGISGMILAVPAVTAAQKIVGILLEHRLGTFDVALAPSPQAGKLPVRPV